MTRKYLQNGNIYKFSVLNVQRRKTKLKKPILHELYLYDLFIKQ